MNVYGTEGDAIDKIVSHTVGGTTASGVPAGGTITFLPLTLVQTWWELLILRVIVGLELGVGVTLAYAAGAEATPHERRGLSMGVLGSASSYGASLGALVAGVVSVIGLEKVFLVDAGLFAVVLVVTALAFNRAERRALSGYSPG